ncbi:MAG: hypothetical protein R3B06_01375 [Kofleriaceae bacterium]
MRWNAVMDPGRCGAWLVSTVAVVAGVGALGCSDRRPVVTPTPPPPLAVIDAGPDAGRIVEPAAPPRVAPHGATIAATALARDGAAALSVDVLGDVRLWPALDGSAEPVALPIHGALALELVASDDGFVVGAVDLSGAPHLLRVDHRGGLRGRTDIPAVPQAIGLVALGPDAWLLTRADQTIELYDRDGRRRADTARDGTRVEAIRAEASDRALVVVSRRDGTQASFAAVTLAVAGDQLTWGASVPLVKPPDTPVEVAVSPDGKHLAYLSTRALIGPAGQPPTIPPAPVAQDVAGFELPPPGPISVVIVIDRATGADVTPSAVQAVELRGARRLGFLDDHTIQASSTAGESWTATLAADATPRSRDLPFTGLPSISGGRVVAGLQTALVVASGDGAPAFLSYQTGYALQGAASPDGTRIAWIGEDRRYFIEALDRTAPPVVGQGGDATFVTFADDATALVVGPTAVMAVDASDGTVRHQRPIPGGASTMRWHPRTRWLVGVDRARGAWWAVHLDGDALGPVREVRDGAIDAWVLDADLPSAPVVVTIDRRADARFYSGSQLTDGVPAAGLAKLPKVHVDGPVRWIEPSGAVLRFDGTLTRSPAVTSPARTALGARDGIDAVVDIPGTDRVVVTDPGGLITAIEADGRIAWAVPAGVRGAWLTVSDDGRRIVAASPAGSQVIDAASGAVIDQRCGWVFGSWPTPPTSRRVNLAPVCQ